MIVIIAFVYLFLSQSSFVFSNQLIETDFSSLISVMSESIKSTGNISGSNVIQVQNRANVPQPLTLLMNFRDDGTTSFQIMQGKFTRSRFMRKIIYDNIECSLIFVSLLNFHFLKQDHKLFIWTMASVDMDKSLIRPLVVVVTFFVKNLIINLMVQHAYQIKI